MQYLKSLDSLRCLAVFIVVFHHLPVIKNETYFSALFRNISGVDIFFILSGFLISSILLNAKHNSQDTSSVLKKFYIRRFLRIFPLYYVTLFLLFIINPENYRSVFIYDLFYVSNIYMGIKGEYTSITPHFWSLAVEEQFYLLWPFVILLSRIKKEHYWPIFLFMLSLLVHFYYHNFLTARTIYNFSYLSIGAVWACVLYYYNSNVLIKRARSITGVYIIFYLIFKPLYVYLVNSTAKDLMLFDYLFVFFLVVRFTLPFQFKIFKNFSKILYWFI